jgi:ubiquitin-like-conjugating enzyme ATG10
MPCLWFTLQSLPASEPAFDIDTVFRRLVPDQFKDAMRGAGPIGGISGDVRSAARYCCEFLVVSRAQSPVCVCPVR